MSIEDLHGFRGLASSTLFSKYSRLFTMFVPKLFDRTFLLPVDPDDFEIDVEATSENFGGGEMMTKDYFTEMTQDVIVDDGRIIKTLKPRRKGENYSSFNDFFVVVSTPSEETK
jgi:hypothetical protein